MAGIIEVKDQGKLRIYDADNSHYVDIVVPSSVTANRTITIPDASFTVPQADTNTVYTHPNHSGEVTSSADGATVIADNIVDEANLKISNTPTNGYMLTAQSGNTGGLTWAAAPGGITMADQWRITSDRGGANQLTANWERADTLSAGFIGTGLSESSGVFTFPSTGIYQIFSTAYMASSGSIGYAGIAIQITTNNSSYTTAAESYNNCVGSGQNLSAFATYVLDVTNTTNTKFRLNGAADGGNVTYGGSTASNLTNVVVIRLGDT